MAGVESPSLAVIPAAGLGSRMAEIAVDGCKELLEIDGITMLERTIRELEDAGIQRIIVISSPSKQSIDEACHLRGIEVVHQQEPNGLVDAVLCAKEYYGNSPIVVALPDVLITSSNVTHDLIQAYRGNTILATVEAATPWCDFLCDTGRVIKMEEQQIRVLAEKNKNEKFPVGEIRIMGRYIWNSEFMNRCQDGEIPALQELAELGMLDACNVITEYIDVGLPDGYSYAQSLFNQ
ncbi:MAG: NTP transferase domain-containing protein [Candidatus Thalassarchaeaceae archaeon]|nr:NTP transferase domain-containing protein [Candidatus Thalassarchaeaceae archaeon]